MRLLINAVIQDPTVDEDPDDDPSLVPKVTVAGLVTVAPGWAF